MARHNSRDSSRDSANNFLAFMNHLRPRVCGGESCTCTLVARRLSSGAATGDCAPNRLRVHISKVHDYQLYRKEIQQLMSSSPKGDPPALPGRQSKFDRYRSPSQKLPNVSRQSTRKGISRWTRWKAKPYKVGVQIPYGRRASVARSRAHDDRHCAQVRGGASGGVHCCPGKLPQGACKPHRFSMMHAVLR